MKKTLLAAGLVLLGCLAVGALAMGAKNMFSQGAGAASASAQELFLRAGDLETKNEILAARDAYQEIISEHPDFKDIDLVQKKLENLNMKIIFSAIETPKTVMYEIKPGDSLAKIAKSHHTIVEFIKKSNNLTSDNIRAGQRLRIWTGVFSVLVDKSQNILILKSDDEIVKVYTVSTGSNNSTPVGTFTITSKLVNPVWYKSGAVIPPQSPENALGTRWMGFNLAGYGIHGTVDPQSIGQQVTAGCVRMLNKEVEELYSLLPEGTQVTITD